MASSSASLPSSAAVKQKYDVFLSFRGPDTRKGITSNLYNRLQKRGIKTFMDDSDLKVGDPISPTLLEAIEESRFAIVVLSPNYASSPWCLEELAKICECMKENNRILPLFYKVEPSDVRHRKRSFGEAFEKHESSGRHTSDKVQQWRDALKKVADFSGWDEKNFKTDEELVEKIVDDVCQRIQPSDTESTMCPQEFEPYEATKEAIVQVEKALGDDNVTAVGVFGMGGVGKTTMVQHVADQYKKKGMFDRVLMAVVSQNPELTKIQDTLAEQLGFKLEERTEIPRAARLKEEIMRRNKILIILDDVWKRIELSSIGIPSHEQLQRCHSKVVLTTRRRPVCREMKCQEKIALDILSEEDSWTLFVRSARRSFESTSFEGVAKKVAGECKGLPIALIAVARALGDEDHEEWVKAAQRLGQSQPVIGEDDQEAFASIKLSFDYLKDEDYKTCLLLCCLYPEDHEIEIKDLLRYAVRTRFFQNAETIKEARGTLVSVVKCLKDSSLLSDCRKNGFVKMHDVIRDSVIRIAESEHKFLVKAGYGLQDWPRRLDAACTTISLMRNKICKLPDEKLVCPKLQILLLNSNYSLEEFPEAFFQTLNELRVLDLSNTYLPKLPRSFGLLTNLQALYLDAIDTGGSILGKLKNLEILRISMLHELPVEIGCLTNLRLLDISSSVFRPARIPSKVISKLHNLEELYMINFTAWGRPLYPSFDEVTSLLKLRVLRVKMYDAEYLPKNVESIPKWIEFDISIGHEDVREEIRFPDDGHNTIFLELDFINYLPGWFRNEIMPLANWLWWEDCHERLIDIFVESELGRFHGLKHLLINEKPVRLQESERVLGRMVHRGEGSARKPVFENLEELVLGELDCSDLCAVELAPGSLINLKKLVIIHCYNWGNILLPTVSLCDGPAPPAMFQNLQLLWIKNCDLPGSLFTYDVAQGLSQLNYLELIECPLLERIVEASNKKSILPKLKHLTLSYLPMLYCESATFDIECPSLEELSVSWCDQLQGSLFTDDVAQGLSQLVDLTLIGCLSLERIVEASNKKTILPKLKHLILRDLPMLYYERATFDVECPSLESLDVWECPNFSASPSDFHSRKQVQFRRIG